jgi:hypothetical protein
MSFKNRVGCANRGLLRDRMTTKYKDGHPMDNNEIRKEIRKKGEQRTNRSILSHTEEGGVSYLLESNRMYMLGWEQI